MADLAKLGIEIKNRAANAAIKDSKRELTNLGTSAGLMQRTVTRSFAFMRKEAIAFAGVAAGLGTAFAFLLPATRQFAEFEEKISELSAITGAVGADLEFLSNTAREFGATTTLSATQAAEAMKLIASAKPELLENNAALAQTTQEMLLLAEAAKITLPQAARTLGVALNQFQEDASEANRFVNVLAAGARFGSSEIVDTADAIRRSGTAAAGAGVSFEELNASIQTLARFEVKGSEAGTALRNVILRLSVANDQINPKIVGFNQALENLGELALSDKEKLKLFGLENIQFADILINNIDVAEEFREKLTGTQTATEQASTNTDNLKGDLKSLNSVWEELKITVGEDVNPTVRSFIQVLTDGIAFVTDMHAVLRGFADFMVGTVAAGFIRLRATVQTTFLDMLSTIRESMGAAVDFIADALDTARSNKAIGFGADLLGLDPETLRRTSEGLREYADSLSNEAAPAQQAIADTKRDIIETSEAEILALEQLIQDAADWNARNREVAASNEAVAASQENVNDAVNAAAAGTERLVAELSEGLRQKKMDHLKELAEDGERLRQSVLTPLEEFNQKMREVEELRAAGAISAETAARAEEKFREELERGTASLEELKTTGTSAFDELKTAVEGWSRSFADAMLSGERGFKGFVDSVVREISRIALAKATEPLFNALSSGLETFFSTGSFNFGGGSSGGGGAGGGFTSSSGLGLSSANLFASGGIARGPSVNVIGEGSSPEAFVPLPDGKTIPVTIKGGTASGGTNVNVDINVVNESNAEVTAQNNGMQNGRVQIQMLVKDTIDALVTNGQLDKTLKQGYGVDRAGRTR